MTETSYLPFRFTATTAAREKLRGAARAAASAAAQAIVAQRQGLDVHFLQVKTQGHLLAVCSRVSGSGVWQIEIDLGDPNWPSIMLLPKPRRDEKPETKPKRRRD